MATPTNTSTISNPSKYESSQHPAHPFRAAVASLVPRGETPSERVLDSLRMAGGYRRH